jgi:chromosome partitioning protein
MNHKGGVGKTTTALNVADALHEAGKRVLLLDLDSQCSASFAMGLSRKALASGPSTADVLFKEGSLANSCYHNTWPGIDLVPASLDLAHAGLRLSPSGSDLKKLTRALSDSEVTSTYDTVLIDCPPAISVVTLNALLASTDLLIPAAPSFLSLQGLRSIGEVVVKTRSEHDNTIALSGIALTRLDQSRPDVEEATQEIRSHYHRNVFRTVIPESTVVEEAQRHHQSVLRYAPDAEVSQRYRTLTGEITQRWASYDAVFDGIKMPSSEKMTSS